MLLPHTHLRNRLSALMLAALVSVSLPVADAWAQKSKDKNVPQSQTVPADTAAEPVDASVPAAISEFKVSVPTITTEGSNVDEAVLREMFEGRLGEHVEALASLTADRIMIPELRMSYLMAMPDAAPEAGEIVYRNLELVGVKDGVATSAKVESGTVDYGNGTVVTLNGLTSGLLSLKGILAFYDGAVVGDDRSLQPIYQNLAFAGGTLVSSEVDCTIGPISIAEFKARPLKTSFGDLFTLAQQLENQGETPSPAVIGQFIDFYVDFLSAFESTPMESEGFDCTGTTTKGEAIAISLGSASMGGFQPGRYPSFSANDLKVSFGADGTASLGSVVFKGFDFSSVLATIQDPSFEFSDSWVQSNFRKLIPAFEGFSVSGFNMDAPDEDVPGRRIKFALGGFDLTLDNYVNGIPALVSTSASNLVLDLAQLGEDADMAELLALGLDKIDIGFNLQANWEELSNTIVVKDLTVQGVDLGKVSMAGTVGNATENLFALDEGSAFIAAIGLNVQNLSLDVTDAGMLNIALKQIAAEQGQDPEVLRAIGASLAQGFTMSTLGGNGDAVALGKAVGNFIKGSKSLSIAVSAVDAAGLGLADLMAAEGDPASLIGKVKITAKSE